VCSIVLDVAHVFVCISIVDASVDVLAGVFVGEIMPEIAISHLVYLLVMTVPLLAVAANIPNTAVATSRLSTVVVGRATAAMFAGPW
jgi:hypothetical protein